MAWITPGWSTSTISGSRSGENSGAKRLTVSMVSSSVPPRHDDDLIGRPLLTRQTGEAAGKILRPFI